MCSRVVLIIHARARTHARTHTHTHTHTHNTTQPQVLPITLDHLKVAWMSLELSTHINMLGLVGNIARAAPYHQFRPYVSLLLSHVLRVLNICVHITSKTAPVASSKGRGTLDKKALTPPKGASVCGALVLARRLCSCCFLKRTVIHSLLVAYILKTHSSVASPPLAFLLPHTRLPHTRLSHTHSSLPHTR
jgi:hypothetical protein